MSGYDNPLVLVTRPRAFSEEFVAALGTVTSAFEPLIAPAFELEALSAEVPPYDEVIFTSRAGVRFGPKGDGRLAWCVGEATADAARAAGYETRTADGDADGLVVLILGERPVARLMHFRGESVASEVAARLVEGGLDCVETVLYRKVASQIPATDRAILEGVLNVVVPVFSAETVSILAEWELDWSGFHVVAISEKVAGAAAKLNPAKITVVPAPNTVEMTQAVARLIA